MIWDEYNQGERQMGRERLEVEKMENELSG